MELSVVILTWNSEQYIEACLDSLIQSVPERLKPYEVFIVDNGSSDRTGGILQQYSDKYSGIIKPIFLETNTGTTYSRNQALRRASGELIAIIDSDVIFSGKPLERLELYLRESKKVGMVVPKLIYGDGRYQKSTDCFPTLISKAYRYFCLKGIEQKEGSLDTTPYIVDYAISAFWLIKKEVVEKVGLLDEKIFYAPEDVDYCLRVWKKGYSIVYVPEIAVIHNAQEISRGFKINRAFFEHIKGLLYFFSKHNYWVKKPSFVNDEEN